LGGGGGGLGGGRGAGAETGGRKGIKGGERVCVGRGGRAGGWAGFESVGNGVEAAALAELRGGHGVAPREGLAGVGAFKAFDG
jgi:hypothetical protein